MSSGLFVNKDGLPLQFGTSKALPDWSGEYHVGASTREVEFLVPLIPVTLGGYTMPAIPTSFSGSTTYNAAGISNPDLLLPLQTTAPETASGSALTVTKPQLYIEQVQVTALTPMAGGTSVAIGLATLNASQAFVQVTPDTGVQLIDTLVTATFATTAGLTMTWNRPGSTGYGNGNANVAGGGAWIKQMPLITNVITPLPTNAWVSAIATGSFTDGVLKVKVRYAQMGCINQ